MNLKDLSVKLLEHFDINPEYGISGSGEGKVLNIGKSCFAIRVEGGGVWILTTGFRVITAFLSECDLLEDNDIKKKYYENNTAVYIRPEKNE